jgi:hypothetical protein
VESFLAEHPEYAVSKEEAHEMQLFYTGLLTECLQYRDSIASVEADGPDSVKVSWSDYPDKTKEYLESIKAKVAELNCIGAAALGEALCDRFQSQTDGAGNFAVQMEISKGVDANGSPIYKVDKDLIQLDDKDTASISVVTVSFNIIPGTESMFGLRTEYLPK